MRCGRFGGTTPNRLWPRGARNRAFRNIPRTSSSSASPRPGPSTASTRSSPRGSATSTSTAANEVIDGLFKTYIRRATELLGRGVRLAGLGLSRQRGRHPLQRPGTCLPTRWRPTTAPRPSTRTAGAITGIVGVNRDPIGTGHGCDLLCQHLGLLLRARPFYDGELPAGLLHPRRIRDGVHQGVDRRRQPERHPLRSRLGALRRALPRQAAGVLRHRRRLPRSPSRAAVRAKDVQPGDLVVMVGGRIGKDGIHGATFSSEELHRGVAGAGRADRRPHHAEAR